MKAHIVLAHPEPKSFNAHLAGISRRTLEARGYNVSVTDLYAMGFDPAEAPKHYQNRKDSEAFHVQTEQRFNANNNSLPNDVNEEITRLLESELLIIHFPLWWFGMPAILKGWMDRVFVYGRMYRSRLRYDNGICVGKKMVACVTTGADEHSCSYRGREGDTRLHLWPILFPFRYLGYQVLVPQIIHGVGGVSFIENKEDGLSTLEAFTNQWEDSLSTLNSRPSIQYNSDNDFDDSKKLIPNASVYSPFVRHSPKPIADSD